MKCKDCKFWVPKKDKEQTIEYRGGEVESGKERQFGWCHRFPEPVDKIDDNWCGEFAEKYGEDVKISSEPADLAGLFEDLAKEVFAKEMRKIEPQVKAWASGVRI